VNQNVHVGLIIPSNHPALPGHFPGRPVVPGAVILAEVAHAAANLLGAGRISGFVAVKFMSPMLPEQRCELAFTREANGTTAFELTHDGRRVASGRLRFETTSAKN
jgi:3-hydroxyacyl-[acyl-carrier-protein] dehydratase